MIGGCDIRPAEPPPRPEAAFPMSAGLLKRVGWLGDVPAGKWLVRCGQEKRDAVDVARVTEGGVDAPRASVWRRRHTAGWRVRVCKQPFHSNSRWEQRERGGTSGIRHEHKCRVDDRLWSRLTRAVTTGVEGASGERRKVPALWSMGVGGLTDRASAAGATPAGARSRSGRQRGWPARQRNSSLIVSARQLQPRVRRQAGITKGKCYLSADNKLLPII